MVVISNCINEFIRTKTNKNITFNVDGIDFDFSIKLKNNLNVEFLINVHRFDISGNCYFMKKYYKIIQFDDIKEITFNNILLKLSPDKNSSKLEKKSFYTFFDGISTILKKQLNPKYTIINLYHQQLPSKRLSAILECENGHRFITKNLYNFVYDKTCCKQCKKLRLP